MYFLHDIRFLFYLFIFISFGDLCRTCYTHETGRTHFCIFEQSTLPFSFWFLFRSKSVLFPFFLRLVMKVKAAESLRMVRILVCPDLDLLSWHYFPEQIC